MNVQQLIEQLQKFEPSMEVEIPIKTFTKVNPVAYSGVDFIQLSPWNKVRIFASLPDNMYAVEKKAKP